LLDAQEPAFAHPVKAGTLATNHRNRTPTAG
jgi:hypothetical protein